MAAFDDIPQFDDLLFRQKRKHGKFRVVAPPPASGPFADTHAHVQLLANPPLEVAKAAAYGVGFICDIIDIVEDDPAVFDDMDDWPAQARELLQDLAPAAPSMPNVFTPADGLVEPQLPTIRFAVGCHPHNAKDYTAATEAELVRRLADPRAVAVGEVGLDYHYDLSPREVQRRVFRQQIRIAHQLNKPLALHVREAHAEAFAILKEEGFPKAGTLLHCFDLDWATLEPWVEQGCYVAFGGALTFKRNSATREALKKAPRNQVLTETDSPYMAPEPVRGMPCGPAHTLFTVACMQEVLGCETAQQKAALCQQLFANAQRFFGL